MAVGLDELSVHAAGAPMVVRICPGDSSHMACSQPVRKCGAASTSL